MTKYMVYYTSKYDMFVITKDDGTLTGKYETDLYCKNEIMANKICDLLNENKQLKQQLAHHTRMHEWFRNEEYLLQNKLDNREDEIRRLKGDVK